LIAISVLPPAVRTYVHDFEVRARRLALLRGIGIAAAALLGWMLACCLVDRAAQLGPMTRSCLLVLGVIAAAVLLWRPIAKALRKDVDWTDAAQRIESRTPDFGQRLVTVVSRVLGPSEHRGSDDMLRALLRDVSGQAERRDASRLLPLRHIAWPWLVVALLAGTFILLARVPGVHLSELSRRFFAPLADIPPVTSTVLDVPTGSRDVVQSAPLRVEANVGRMRPGAQVLLFISGEGGEDWSRNTMEPVPSAQRHDGGLFAFAISSVDRDFRYYVTAGDARSRSYAVRVKRPPAVERFSIRYDYPAYSGRSALTVVNSDGLIEAPIGTRATITVTATEPLNSALLTVGAEKIMMDRVDANGGHAGAVSDAARMRRAAITINKDARYSIDLVSDRQVPGVGPAGTMQIRAIPDGRPLVRLSRAGESLRLHPREILPLTYQALDDYGIASLVLVAQVNSAKPVEVPLQLRGDARRQERDYEFDLATLPLTVGDVLALSLAATDSAGQRVATEAVQVLVSPRSIDVATYQRIAELERAANSASTLNEQLTAAAAALEESDREAASRSLAFLAAVNRSNRQLSGAAETATLMTKSMYRAVVNSRSPDLSNALAGWIDEARVQAWLAEDLFRRADQPAGMGSESRGLLARSVESTRVLREEIRTVAAGERADALLADRENLLASQKRAQTPQQPADAHQRLEQSLRRAREDVAAGVREIGLDPAAADLDAQLKSRVDAAQTLLRGKARVDFASVAKDWSLALQRDRTQPVVLDERLSAAAEAEALRNDADLIRARDLNLAARAASRIESLAQADPSGRTISAAMFDEFAFAMANVQREHDLNRLARAGQKPGREELDAVHATAEAGRSLLQRWAGDVTDDANAAPLFGMPGRQSELEELALRASAETASRNYAAASALDNRLAGGLAGPSPATLPGAVTRPSPSPVPLPGSFQHDVRQAVKRAERIDTLGADQQKLATATTTPATQLTTQPATPPATPPATQQAPSLAGRQREVAEAIAQVSNRPTRESDSPPSADPIASDPNWRGRATAAVLAAQEALAAMPQQLAAAQDALPTWRDALARAEQARRDASAMPDTARQPAAAHAAAQAEADAADAAERFQERRKPVSPTRVQQLASSLEPFSPETDMADDVIAHGLLPALQRLEDAAVGGNIAGVARAADEARQSIESAQRELAHAQEQLTARDPLVAAKWFARAAAGSLAQSPPDVRAAQSRQRDVSDALALAWDRTVHEAAALRMAALPTMQSVYGNALPASTAPGTAAAASPVTAGNSAPVQRMTEAASGESTAAPDWVRLRPRDVPSASAALPSDGDPQGFEEPLRLYFQALAKLQSQAAPAITPAVPAATQAATTTPATAPAAAPTK
jgi:hypothetical protein